MDTTQGNEDKDMENRLDQYIESITAKEGYITYDVEKLNLSTKGGSYLGILYLINIKGKTNNGDKQTHIFAKNIIHIDRMIFNVETVFGREVFFYLELSKIFNDLQIEANVPANEMFKVAKAFDESNTNAIILENLTKRGFKTYYRMDLTNIEFATLAMKNLAKFHALTFVMQAKKPEYFVNKIKTINNPLYFNEFWKDFNSNMIKNAYKYLNKSILDRYEGKIREKLDKCEEYLNDENCLRVLCHGDYRPNNIMVKETNGKAEEVIAVDYQIMNYANPVLDIIYFIMWSTDQDFRRKHMIDLKNTYYEHMETFLKYFNLDLKSLYPRDNFEKQFKDKLNYGVYIAVVFLPILFHPDDDIPDLTNIEDTFEGDKFHVDLKYGERLNGIMEDFIKWGYFD